ncbi:MAG: hypothetical protein JSW02_08820 [candidate division WOR-3 bacterium]|nr:MAG: hypothetical protein JSW02_08820 [candidate division WOR-3 bacterium]
MAKVRISIKGIFSGGALLLLPLVLFSDHSAGLTLAFNATDNLQFLNIKDQGATLTVDPFIQFQGFVTLTYDGAISVIGLDRNNLFFGNDIALLKHIFLPGVGNKNTMYIDAYLLLTSDYDIYRMNEYSIGDSISFYVAKRYFLTADLQGIYTDYRNDSLTDYQQAHIRTSLSIPMPYFFLTPLVRGGIRMYDEQSLPFYGGSVSIDLPLTIDFSMTVSGSYLRHSEPTSHITTLTYADDPFFERENLEQIMDATIECTKIFMTHRSRLNLSAGLFNKRFFEMDNMDREDEGFTGQATLTHTIDRTTVVSVAYSYLTNSSTLGAFTYDKNTIDLSLQFLFW